MLNDPLKVMFHLLNGGAGTQSPGLFFGYLGRTRLALFLCFHGHNA